MMNELLVGYARVSTEHQDLTAQRNSLAALGVGDDRIYVDHGLTGTNRDRPGLRLALAACHIGDTLVVTKLDRLARSLPDARDILDELTRRNVRLSLGGSLHDPTDPVGRLLFNVLAMVAEFEADLISMRTREGMKVAKAKGRLRGKQPKLTVNQAKHLLELRDGGNYSTSELEELFRVGRSTSIEPSDGCVLCLSTLHDRSRSFLRTRTRTMRWAGSRPTAFVPQADRLTGGHR
jgi:DNA invertase Pin-like site-specific DNA recombinase